MAMTSIRFTTGLRNVPLRSYRIWLLLFLILGSGCRIPGSPAKTTVLMFIVDGLQSDAARVAIANGAVNMKFLADSGVCVEEVYCVSPAVRLYLPDSSLPWGTSSPPNVAMHTGTHVFESRRMDDVFLAARRAGVKSVFSGAAENYSVFNTADYCYAVSNTDSIVVDFAMDHFQKNGVRLLSLHIQETRSHWTGPDDKLRPGSSYQQYLLTVDHLLGKLIDVFRAGGVWDSTYIILSSDHGMGTMTESDHPPSHITSWQPYMNFYGPGIKGGETIPYAETPDLALLICHFLRLPPLRGHTDTAITVEPPGPTGTLLLNIFEEGPAEINHPKYVRRYLEGVNWKPSDDYSEYRRTMVSFLKATRDK
jgi:hypothetical protein